MAVALLKRGTGLRAKCFHRELAWRQRAALFCSKSSDRKQPRRTHIKKAKPQPAVDVAKLLEQLFSQRRPGTAPLASSKAHPAKAFSMPTKPPTTTSRKVVTSNVPLFSKTKPVVSVCPAASSAPNKTTSAFNATQQSPQPNSASSINPKTALSSETPYQSPLDCTHSLSSETVPTTPASPLSLTSASLGSEAAECKTLPVTIETVPALPLSAYMVETNAETSSSPSTTVEVLTNPAAKSPEESSLPLVEILETPEGEVKPTEEEAQTKSTDSGVTDLSHAATEEPIIETPTASPVEGSFFSVETLQTRPATFEGPVEPIIDVTVKDVQIKSTEITSTGSAVAAAAEADDLPPSHAPREVLLEQEMAEAQTEALENDKSTDTHTDLDPVQKLFLEKIREYNNLHRLTGAAVETDPDYERCLSEETARLQRLYGGGDLSSFPQFTFPEPNIDQELN